MYKEQGIGVQTFYTADLVGLDPLVDMAEAPPGNDLLLRGSGYEVGEILVWNEDDGMRWNRIASVLGV